MPRLIRFTMETGARQTPPRAGRRSHRRRRDGDRRSACSPLRARSGRCPGLDSSNFYPFEQITKSNVGQLEVAWFYPYAAPTFSPVFADDVLYGLGRNGSSLVALDATTGKEIWVHEGLNGITSKGINYWESEDGKDRRLIFAVDSFLQQIDARTGKSIMTFGDNGIVDMRVGLPRAEGTSARAQPASPGRIWRNIMIFGGQSGEAIMTPPGDIRAYDVLTGKLLWQFHTIPRPGEFGYETNPPDGYKYIGGANNWGEMSIDEARGIVYIPTGSATADFYGGDRHGQNLFANCLLALDVRTGKRLWHFQTIHHDLWDLDNVSAPQLVTVTHNGQKVDVVAHAGKTGFLYVFNRVTGEPLWPIEERPVPKSDVPVREVVADAAVPDQAGAVRAAVVHGGRRQPVAADAGGVRGAQGARAQGEERHRPAGRPVQSRRCSTATAISMPGNQGGSNWGHGRGRSAARPRVRHRRQPGGAAAPQRREGSAGAQRTRRWRRQPDRREPSRRTGRRAYTQYCAACHGADQRGAIPGVPSLVGVTDRIDEESLRVIVVRGAQQHAADPRRVQRGDSRDPRVPADHESGRPGRRRRSRTRRRPRRSPLPPGPVVASGGAPRPPLPPRYGGPFYPGVGGTAGNMPWPEDVEAAKLPTRYQSGYNVMATSTKPPYTTITAYDLNTGEIKWQVPNGDDPGHGRSLRQGRRPARHRRRRRAETAWS